MLQVRFKRSGHEIRGPWPRRARVAVLSPWFRVKGSARSFDEFTVRVVKRYRPEALAGCVASLRRLARDLLDSGESLPSLRYGVLALTALGYPSLAEADRDLLWDAFQMPVFEQCRCRDGLLYAEECIAHRGLHLRMSAHIAGVMISKEPCVCGDSSPRIVGSPAYRSIRVRELAIGA